MQDSWRFCGELVTHEDGHTVLTFGDRTAEIGSFSRSSLFYARHGSRLAQVRIRLASSSPTNVSLVGSNVTLRPSIQAMAPA